MEFAWQHSLEAIDADTDSGAVVPVAARGLYIKGDDGKFSLEDGLKKRLDVSGLTSALDKERKNHRTVKELVDKWAKLGETPDAVSQKLQELTEAATKGGQAAFDKLKANLEEGHKTALLEKDKLLGARDRTLEKYLVENTAITAITEAKGVPELLLPHIKAAVKVEADGKGDYVVRVVDADGDPRGDGKGGFMTIKDLVGEMKASTVFGRAFEASGTTGSGTQPGAGGKKTSTTAQKAMDQMSPTEKIAAGLKKGQMRQ